MPDVGLFSSTEPLPEDARVIIKFGVEVNGLRVYTETYNVDTLASEVREDEARALELWARRLLCVVNARHRPGFSSALTRCLADGKACDFGAENCEKVDMAVR